MRLLHFEGGTFQHGRVTSVEFQDAEIPRYGIISHTWITEEAEVTLKDIVEGTGEKKAGYNKIRFCGARATEELQYFWLDTCCIDRSNDMELQEAINSMFRWYQNAAVCYVFLSDIAKSGASWKNKEWHCSRWFRRAWTLQELIAPKSVEFYSLDGDYLGNRDSNAPRMFKATGIHGQLFHGRPLSRFSVEERLQWAEWRETTREEDSAYCLLGLLNVHMPIRYGEGRKQALIRLQQRINESRKSHGLIKPVIRSISKMVRGDAQKIPGKLQDVFSMRLI